MTKTCSYLLCAFMLTSSAALASDPSSKKMIKLYSNQVPGSVYDQWLSKVYHDLYNRLGVRVQVIDLSEVRASKDADSGKIDGQFGRVFDYQQNHPNQIRIDVPIYQVTFEAYTHKNSGIRLEGGWQSLDNEAIRVDYRRGVINAEENLSNDHAYTLQSVTNIVEGFQKLSTHSSDLFIHANIGAFPYLASKPFKNIIISAGVMDVQPMYHYISQNQKALAPKIEQTLSEMINDGTVLKYCTETVDKSGGDLCQVLIAQ
ncbi:transporter substrate-binding domain-containing protein [Vibrio sp. SCSIO 43136]|uniref:transporter substrate-binding domain-containing protein n=1 Tax=Vibrio sp. SCSIO 43136 TaxID=2819101 RepID=UPI0020757981|nr:transporter substrate-binding domain-containing protein [Vibrio sp. SCSIO 43136]USD67542.1 transporter substrate-binding domain-containing protein [Vibrio sp. SCSIO 43136]